MNVCVQGLWHLGSVTAAGLASLGHRVLGLDFDATNIDRLNKGTPPLFEPGLEDLIKSGLASGLLRFSENPEAAGEAQVLWVAYDTPVDEEDNADVDFVVRQVEKSLPHLASGSMVLVSSQMPVGSVRRLEEIARRRFPGKGVEFACSPENLRLGKALDVFLKPDRIVAGVRSDAGRQKVERLLRPITDRIEWMSVESAEMTKHAINAFLATSVTFANEIASICEGVGADAKEVERGLKTEGRIGPKAYLSPGGAFAGGTLARDIAFLGNAAADLHLTIPLLTSVRPSNEAHKQWAARKLQSLFPDLSKTRVAIWGLTYKPGTDTLRRSMSVELCNWLIARDVKVIVHDPAVKALPAEWSGKVERSDHPVVALSGAQALVMATEWPEYRDVPANQIGETSPGIVVLDANRFLSHLAGHGGLKYVAVGMPSQSSAGSQRSK
ncbi:MAG: UDP-glucose/GDP-mannose dehydrogenase family protein [Betaproteobacteria bacterium]|nr:MAG: UDP-glucose/GDP-mannose dehydrogenase family protein [Betaproteobacteria bacterium]